MNSREPLSRPFRFSPDGGGKDGAGGMQQTPGIPRMVFDALRSPGESLDPTTLEEMQSRFQADFSRVQVHAGPLATEATDALGSYAFTVGNDIVFGDGGYDVDSTGGRELLAHELTHVVQQKNQEKNPDTVEVDAAESHSEHQAEIASTGGFSELVSPVDVSGSAVLQRAPKKADPPARKSELATLDRRMMALERRQAATTQDLYWRGMFSEKLSSWKQAVYRVAGGIDSARGGFTDAQVKQADFDALVTQIFLAIATVGFAAGFEPLLTRALMTTKIGGAMTEAESKVTRIGDIVEKVENPAVSAVSAQANIVGAVPRRDASPPTAPEVPASTGLAFLSERLETLESYSQRIEHAFVVRSEELGKLSNDVAATLDTAKQEEIYAGLMSSLNGAADGIEKMRPSALVSTILERHMWSAWLTKNYMSATVGDFGYSPASFEDFGGYIEDRLNEIGVSALAGVELSGHWYSSNSSGYVEDLLRWARSYRGSIHVGGPV